MPKKQYNIDFYTFVSSLELHAFTVEDVTRHLLEAYSEEFDKKKNATQFVYRRLKQLIKEGVLFSTRNENSKAIIFRWCSESNESNQRLKQLNKDNESIVSKLKEKIQRYKTEMLTNLGETEAYSEWIQEMPEFAEYVKPHYQNTREQAKLMLGKVKGFERLLADYEARIS